MGVLALILVILAVGYSYWCRGNLTSCCPIYRDSLVDARRDFASSCYRLPVAEGRHKCWAYLLSSLTISEGLETNLITSCVRI